MVEKIGSYFSAGLGRVVAFLPNLVSGIIIAAVGYLLSRVAGSLVRRGLARLRFDGFVARHLHPTAASAKRSASATAGSVVFWLGILVTASLTANALGLGALSAGINKVLAYVPNVLVALIIVAVAGGVARVLGRMIGGVANGTLARAAQVLVMGIGVFMALDQIGIARNIVMALFTAIVGAAAVAAAIAFGVGNIGLAREKTRQWEQRGREEIEEGPRPTPPPTMPRPEEPAGFTKH
jgi:Mechanosensitive ion channel, conserved TM helix